MPKNSVANLTEKVKTVPENRVSEPPGVAARARTLTTGSGTRPARDRTVWCPCPGGAHGRAARRHSANTKRAIFSGLAGRGGGRHES